MKTLGIWGLLAISSGLNAAPTPLPVNTAGERYVPRVWHNAESDAAAMRHWEAERRFRKLSPLPFESREEWMKYRLELRQKLWTVFGVKYDAALPLDSKVTRICRRDGYSIRHLSYQSRPGFRVTASLYVPDGPGKFPGVINMHGHWYRGRLAGAIQSRGITLAKNGYVCLSVDAFGAGERSLKAGEFQYHGSTLGASLFNIGETLLGIQVVDNMRGVDLLTSLPEVDAARIGAVGGSGGGNQTMWLAAMDDRVAAAMPVVSVGTFAGYVSSVNCVCETLPDILNFTETSGVLALVAPRALLVVNCLKDQNPTFAPAQMLRSFTDARPIFQLLDADGQLTCRIFNLTHGFHPEIREAMLGFLDWQLKKIGHGAPRPEKPFTTLDEHSMLAYPDGPRDPEVWSIAAYCRKRGQELHGPFLAQDKFNRQAKLDELRRILRITKPLQRVSLTVHPSEGGWERCTLEFDDGRMLPVIVRRQGEPWVLLAHPGGKSAVPEAVLNALWQSGCSLALLDLSGQGENQEQPDSVAPYHQFSRAQMLLGRTVSGEWQRELSAAVGMLRERYGAREVSLYAFREVAPAALFTAAFDASIRNITLSDAPISYRCRNDAIPAYFNMALPLYGILKWGDVSLAAALCAGQVQWVNPLDYEGTPVADMSAWHQEYKSLKTKIESGTGD